MNRAKSAGRLWSAFSDATLSNPVGFFFAFRWLTLALAIAIILSHISQISRVGAS